MQRIQANLSRDRPPADRSAVETRRCFVRDPNGVCCRRGHATDDCTRLASGRCCRCLSRKCWAMTPRLVAFVALSGCSSCGAVEATISLIGSSDTTTKRHVASLARSQTTPLPAGGDRLLVVGAGRGGGSIVTGYISEGGSQRAVQTGSGDGFAGVEISGPRARQLGLGDHGERRRGHLRQRREARDGHERQAELYPQQHGSESHGPSASGEVVLDALMVLSSNAAAATAGAGQTAQRRVDEHRLRARRRGEHRGRSAERLLDGPPAPRTLRARPGARMRPSTRTATASATPATTARRSRTRTRRTRTVPTTAAMRAALDDDDTVVNGTDNCRSTRTRTRRTRTARATAAMRATLTTTTTRSWTELTTVRSTRTRTRRTRCRRRCARR